MNDRIEQLRNRIDMLHNLIDEAYDALHDAEIAHAQQEAKADAQVSFKALYDAVQDRAGLGISLGRNGRVSVNELLHMADNYDGTQGAPESCFADDIKEICQPVCDFMRNEKLRAALTKYERALFADVRRRIVEILPAAGFVEELNPLQDLPLSRRLDPRKVK